nr:nucleotidyltransferase family protein [Acinetobacter seifertii]
MKSPCLLKTLAIISQLHPKVYLSAGAVRNTVWSYLHGKTYDLNRSDMDVIYYNANECDDSYQKELQSELKSKFPNQDWDVVNQALVHTWANSNMRCDSLKSLMIINKLSKFL